MSKERKADRAKKYGILAAMTVFMALLMLLVMLDVFTHGYFCNEAAYGPLPPEDVLGTVDLAEGAYTLRFTPAQKHFRGFELALAHQPEGNSGRLTLTVAEEDGGKVGDLTLDLSGIHENQWYKTYFEKELKPGRAYTLTIAAADCPTYPHLQLVGDACVAPETTSGGLLLGYAYGASTLSGAAKASLLFLLVLVWCMVAGELFLAGERKQAMRRIMACLLLWILLFSNYLFRYMDASDLFQEDYDNGSDALVIGSIEASKDGALVEEGYGLGDYAYGEFAPYHSQVGLQGHVFRVLGRFCGTRALRALCGMAMAAVAMGIVLLIKAKYNTLMAGCFYVTFWLSPWVQNYAIRLYWVAFTWFLPMLLGLLCVWRLESRGWRLLCYAGAFVSLLVKCLCGYEYVSTIMMGLIAFPLAELVCALVDKDRKRGKQLFWSILIMGLCAVAGFMAALLAHAQLKGEGNLLEGVRLIIEQDVLRRTVGADMNLFDEVYWPSFNASVLETVYLYFHFNTQVITGIPGNLFPLLCILPLAIFAVDWHHGCLSARDISLYVVCALGSVSWFALAKSHSYIHTHLNFIMWYFGFVQMCLYVPVDKFLKTVKGRRL